MTEPRIVSPEEAQGWVDRPYWLRDASALAHTVATESNRTRAAVEEAVRSTLRWVVANGEEAVMLASMRLDAIENGADY